ncbi:MAG: hypothetical protein ACQEXX_07030 [Bacillota bacterium]
MALDGYLSDVNNQRQYYFPIEDAFHEAIFQNHKIWNSYIHLRKLKDYYGTAKYNEIEVKALADDFEQYMCNINSIYHPRINELIIKLRDRRIVKALFAGD